jgi:hypothetical protein
MRPERVARLVLRWVRLYTRGLPAPVARRRVAEIDADVHDHIADERARGTGDARIARAIAGRTIRGAAADAAWRRRYAKKGLLRPAVRVSVGVAAVLSLPLIGMRVSDAVVWSLMDFVVAGVLLGTIGVALELAAKKAGNLATALCLAVLGIGAAVAGSADDAPGLVLLGILLVVSACVLGVRAARVS